MFLVILRRLHTSHGPIKRLRFYCRMRRNVQLTCPLLSGPFHRFHKKLPSDSSSTHVLGYMDTRQIQISVFSSKQSRFYRGETLQRISVKSGKHNSSGADRILQAGNQRLIVFLRPVITKRIVPYNPLSPSLRLHFVTF